MAGTGAEASYGELLTTSLVVLGAVCVAAFVAVRLLGRVLGPGRVRGAHLLDVVARVPLEPRRSLYVVDVAGKTLLVGTSEMGLSVLSELDAAEVKSRIVPATSFADLVRGALTKRTRLAGAPAATAEANELLATATAAAAAEPGKGGDTAAVGGPGAHAP